MIIKPMRGATVQPIPKDWVCFCCNKPIAKQELNVTAFAEYIGIKHTNNKMITEFGVFHASCLDKMTYRDRGIYFVKWSYLTATLLKYKRAGGQI